MDIEALVNGLGITSGEPAGEADARINSQILLQIRLPRVIAGLLVGAALAAAGVIYQGLLRNPLADPFVIGASGGAALGIVGGHLLLALLIVPAALGSTVIPLLGFLGALAAVWLVYLLASGRPQVTSSSLVLTGFAIGSLLGAANFLLLLTAQPLRERLLEHLSWMLGGVKVVGWAPLVVTAPPLLVALLAAILLARQLDYLALGPAGAARLGVNIAHARALFIVLASLLTALAVSLSGIVALVGLLVPHAVRLLIGPANRMLLPTSALAGGAYLVLIDLMARFIWRPTELPVGILAALLGAPALVWLLRRAGGSYDF